MGKFRLAKTNLLGGEISPTALGRSDIPLYQNACKTLKNMIPLLSGGAYRRPGTKFEKEYDATDDYAPRLFPFVVSRDEAYCGVLGRDSGGAYIDMVRAVGNSGTTQVTNIASAHEWRPATSGYRALSLPNNSPLEHYYDEWHAVQHAQSADVMYMAHPAFAPRVLTRTGEDAFTCADYDDALSGASRRDAIPYLPQNTTSITISVSATSGTGVTITFSSAPYGSDSIPLGAIYKIYNGTEYGCLITRSLSSTTTATADYIVSLPSGAGAVTTWWESAWSNYRGWPRSVAFYQNRLAYGGTRSNPDSIWFSETYDYSQMSTDSIVDPRVNPSGSQPFTLELSTNQLNRIQWMSPLRGKLAVGTEGEEISVDMDRQQGFFGADSRVFDSESQYGSEHLQPAKMGNELAVPLFGGEVRALGYSNDQGSLIASPVQLLYDEKPEVEKNETGQSEYSGLNRKVRALAWDESRKTLWYCDTRGSWCGLTRDRLTNVSAWHQHEPGGYDATKTGGTIGSTTTLTIDPAYSNPAGSVVSLAVVPNVESRYNDLWIVVKRYIDSAYVYHLERMIGGPFDFGEIKNVDALVNMDYGFTDAHYRTTPGAATYAISSGLDHLEGETLEGTIVGRRGMFSTTTDAVSSGAATIQTAPDDYDSDAYLVTVGLPYSGIIEPVSPDVGSAIGSAMSTQKRIHDLFLKFYRTLACKVGRNAATVETLIFRDGDTPMGESPDIYTGDKKVVFSGNYDTDALIYILADKPLPFTLISIVAEGVTYD